MSIIHLLSQSKVEFHEVRFTSFDKSNNQNSFGGRLEPLPSLEYSNPDSTVLLLVLRLEPNVNVALFSSFDWNGRTGPFAVFHNSGILHDHSSKIIQFYTFSSDFSVHPKTRSNEFDLKGLKILDKIKIDPDLTGPRRYDVEECDSDHKVGGMPFFTQIHDELIDPVFDLLNEGFLHILQLGFPTSAEDCPKGSWPFGEYTFHVFAKKESPYEFHYCWG